MPVKKKLISIGVPCFNEELNIIPTYKALVTTTSQNRKFYYEYIFVDNGSSDKTRTLVTTLAKKDKRVIGIFLSRNFGPEASGQAALDTAHGDAFIFYECDRQDPPELIPQFINKWEGGFDIIIGRRRSIEDNLLMAFFRRSFYRIFKTITDIDVPVNAGSFGLMDRKIVNALNSLPEKYRFFRGLRAWIGFKTAYIEYERRKREKGRSSYNIFDYIKHSERGIFGFSYLILDLMIYAGFILVFLSFIFILSYLYIVFVFGNPIQASIPIMLAIVFFGGIQLLAISIIGKYIQVIVEESKHRPLYVIDKTINLPKNSR